MVAAVKYESTLGKLAERLQTKFGPEVGKAMFAAGEIVAGAIRREIASWPGGGIINKSGALARSFLPVLKKNDSKEIVFGVFSKLPYARIQDLGGTIKPTSARALAVPLTAAAARVSPRRFPGLVLIQKRGGTPVLAIVSRGVVQPQYALVSSVTLKGHQYLDKVSKEVLPKAREMVRASLQSLISAK